MDVPIEEAVYGPDQPQGGVLLANLAVVLRDLGEPQDAQRLEDRAQSIEEAGPSPA